MDRVLRRTKGRRRQGPHYEEYADLAMVIADRLSRAVQDHAAAMVAALMAQMPGCGCPPVDCGAGRVAIDDDDAKPQWMRRRCCELLIGGSGLGCPSPDSWRLYFTPELARGGRLSDGATVFLTCACGSYCRTTPQRGVRLSVCSGPSARHIGVARITRPRYWRMLRRTVSCLAERANGNALLLP
jgi:hypothetical protein